MDPSEALENIEIRQKKDRKLRSEALENDIVVKPRIPPRRVWDIWSNRVMPFWHCYQLLESFSIVNIL